MSYVQIPHTADEKFKLFTYQLQKDWFSVPFPSPLYHKLLCLLLYFGDLFLHYIVKYQVQDYFFLAASMQL